MRENPIIYDQFTYYNPVSIHFGIDSLDKLPTLIKNRKALLLTSSVFTDLGITNQIKERVTVVATIDAIDTLPTFELLKQVYEQVHAYKFDVIIALGGGSVIDSAKILSVREEKYGLNPSVVCDFEFVTKLINGLNPSAGGTSQSSDYKITPVIAIPTTAGTSSDLTPWATAWDMQEKKKYSLHLPNLWCEATICDPMLTLSMPRGLTIQTALDALSHSFESIWNKNANPISTQHATYAIKTILYYLPLLIDDLSNVEYREKVMQASLHAGLAFSNTKTAIAHAMSYYMTINKGVPHGIACSFTLPAIVDAIMKQDDASDKLLEIQKTLSGLNPPVDGFNPSVGGILGSGLLSKKLRGFFASLGVSTNVEDYGLNQQDLTNIKASLRTNPRAQNSLVDVETIFDNISSNPKAERNHGQPTSSTL